MGDGEFIFHMEDVLDVYNAPRDSRTPLVCLDEKPLQVLGDVIPALPVKPGREKILDSTYERKGVVDIFTVVAPYEGDHYADVEPTRKKADFARVLKHISDVMYPEAEKIILVMDNLNTHKLGTLYERYAPAEARRIASRFEVHYTPKHGSWLDMAEIEINAMSRECLNRRFASIDMVRSEVAAWEKERNEKKSTITWSFTTEKAREKMERIYPDPSKGWMLPSVKSLWTEIDDLFSC